MIYTQSMHNANATVMYLVGSAGNTQTISVDGKLIFDPKMGYIFLHNSPSMAEYHAPYQTSDYSHDFAYILNGPSDIHSMKGDSRFRKIIIQQEPKILYKQESSGTLFRRLYKEKDNLMFLGVIQKDIADCQLPSPMVTVADAAYITSKGWKIYEKQPSAEERLKAQRPLDL